MNIIGCCLERSEWFLVCEYLANKPSIKSYSVSYFHFVMQILCRITTFSSGAVSLFWFESSSPPKLEGLAGTRRLKFGQKTRKTSKRCPFSYFGNYGELGTVGSLKTRLIGSKDHSMVDSPRDLSSRLAPHSIAAEPELN